MNGRSRYPGGSAYAAEQLAYGAIQPSLVLITSLLLTRATFGELGQAVTVATAGLVAVRSVYGTSILVGRQPPGGIILTLIVVACGAVVTLIVGGTANAAASCGFAAAISIYELARSRLISAGALWPTAAVHVVVSSLGAAVLWIIGPDTLALTFVVFGTVIGVGSAAAYFFSLRLAAAQRSPLGRDRSSRSDLLALFAESGLPALSIQVALLALMVAIGDDESATLRLSLTLAGPIAVLLAAATRRTLVESSRGVHSARPDIVFVVLGFVGSVGILCLGLFVTSDLYRDASQLAPPLVVLMTLRGIAGRASAGLTGSGGQLAAGRVRTRASVAIIAVGGMAIVMPLGGMELLTGVLVSIIAISAGEALVLFKLYRETRKRLHAH
jgi:hypothetical protein